MRDAWSLAIDFGTSRTAGSMAAGDTVTALEVEGNRWMASLVMADPLGDGLLVGQAADNQAGVYPDHVERTPKRNLGTGAPLVLGGRRVEVEDAIAALLRVFADEGRLRRNGRDPGVVVLTHPVRWEDLRKERLREAADRAGLPRPELVEEPVAAALHYARDQVEVGGYVAVYDLGGGTFDTAVLQRTDDAFESIGRPGGDEHIGGEDFDHRLFRYFGECLEADSPELWAQVLESEERRWKRAASDLLVQARRAKESLSLYTSTQVYVPEAERDITVTREQFEEMIRDDVERTVDEMEDTIEASGVSVDELSAVYLVGGSSRIPLVVSEMTARFGDKVATRDEPKSVVALGAGVFALGHADTADVTALPPPRAQDRLDGIPPPEEAWPWAPPTGAPTIVEHGVGPVVEPVGDAPVFDWAPPSGPAAPGAEPVAAPPPESVWEPATEEPLPWWRQPAPPEERPFS